MRRARDGAAGGRAQVRQLHAALPPGGVLVFLTGQREVEALCRRLRAPPRGRRALPQGSNPDPGSGPGAGSRPADGRAERRAGGEAAGDETLDAGREGSAGAQPLAEGVDAFGGDAAEAAGEADGAGRRSVACGGWAACQGSMFDTTR